MPYIKADRKLALTNLTEGFKHEAHYNGLTPSDVTYLITSLMQTYLTQRSTTYADIAVIMGLLECTKLELYRRKFAPYEDQKMKENGDVF